jgi:hypothetical protein
MIAYLEKFYEDELLYSVLSRTYAHSGFSSANAFADAIIAVNKGSIDYCFYNQYRVLFKTILSHQKSLKDLVLQNTCFTLYARFISLPKRVLAFEHAAALQSNIRRYLSIPLNKGKHPRIRYCPKCFCRDKDKYGEGYFRTYHQVPRELTVCPLCGVGVYETALIDYSGVANVFRPLEELNPNGLANEFYEFDNINYAVARYINEVKNQPFNLKNPVLVGDYLYSRLEGTKYLSLRGEQIYLDKLIIDLNNYYKNLKNYKLTKKRLADVLHNKNYSPFYICLVAMFLKISPHELSNPSLPKLSQAQIFDQKVIDLHKSGLNKLKISKKLKVNKEVIRQITLGTYNKPKSLDPKNHPQKWNWHQIDDDCLERLKPHLKKLLTTKNDRHYPKKHFADWLNLKDHSFRSLPKTRAAIMDFNKQNRPKATKT